MTKLGEANNWEPKQWCNVALVSFKDIFQSTHVTCSYMYMYNFAGWLQHYSWLPACTCLARAPGVFRFWWREDEMGRPSSEIARHCCSCSLDLSSPTAGRHSCTARRSPARIKNKLTSQLYRTTIACPINQEQTDVIAVPHDDRLPEPRTNWRHSYNARRSPVRIKYKLTS